MKNTLHQKQKEMMEQSEQLVKPLLKHMQLPLLTLLAGIVNTIGISGLALRLDQISKLCNKEYYVGDDSRKITKCGRCGS
jgi:ABC-type proline/glycine betaine transport system permease subunit